MTLADILARLAALEAAQRRLAAQGKVGSTAWAANQREIRELRAAWVERRAA